MARIIFAIATILAVSTPAFVATDAHAQLDSQQARCQADLAKTSRKYVERILKYRIKCQNKVITGDLPLATDCLFGMGDEVLTKQLLKTQSRLAVAGTDCLGVNLELLGFPNLCEDSGGTFDLTDFKECVLDRTDAILDELLDYYYPPLFERQRGDIALCLQGTPQDATQSLVGKVRAREKCLVGQSYGRIPEDDVNCYEKIMPYGGGTGDEKTDDSLSRAYVELLGTIPKACAVTNIHDLGYQEKCGDPTGGNFNIFDLKNCLFDADRAAALEILGTVFTIEGVCGDGIVQSGEECDNGVANNSDTTPNACRTDCQNPDCGDGVRDTVNSEGCDDGNSVDNDCCLNTCVAASCGDGAINCNEICDNGASNSNTTPDACRATGPNACKPASCGDGVQDTPEQCDDGNQASNDGCSNFCFDEFCGDDIVQAGLGEQCDNGTENGTGPDQCRPLGSEHACKNPFCGDEITDSNEECDDGNTASGDGCDSSCDSEGFCGDEEIQPPEECDDGTTLNSDTTPDACRDNCKNPKCGDSVIDPSKNETCDDGNTNNSDGCYNTCGSCGDGEIQAPEECDDGSTLNSDTTPDACRESCTDPSCGDNVTDPSNNESCDDGNTVNSDACNNDCGSCGDGIKQPSEECDGSNELCPGGACQADSCTCEVVCPTEGELVLYAGVGQPCATNADCPVGVCDQTIDKCRTVTRLDSGWVGLAHNADINDAVLTRGFLDCSDSHGPTCGVCEVAGLDPQTDTCRCANDSRRVCDDKFVSSSPDCGACVGGNLNGVGCGSDTDCASTCVKRCSLDSRRTCTSDADCQPQISYGTCGTTTACANGVECSNNGDCASGTCTGSSACNCYFGAPFPLSSGGTPACIVNRFSADVTGTANVDLGAGEITAKLRTQVFLGIGTRSPCPVCGGTCSNSPTTFCVRDEDCTGGTCNEDPVANDGVRGGTCSTGPQFNDYSSNDKGKPCDKSAFNSSFPAYTTGLSGGWYSLDCLPDVGKNVSGQGLIINLTQRTGPVSMEAVVPCAGTPSLNCPCQVCSADTSVPCNSDADCSALTSRCSLSTSQQNPFPCTTNGDCENKDAGPCSASTLRCSRATSLRCTTNADCQGKSIGTCPLPTCSSVGSGLNPLPNQCENMECSDLGGGIGECTTGPDTTYCEGLVKANGQGILTCGDDEACSPGTVGVDARPCGLVERSGCFLDPITATGVPDPETPIGAAVFCIPATSNSGINSAAGLPGPGRVVNQAKARTFCGNDTSQQYIPGVGGCADSSAIGTSERSVGTGRGTLRGAQTSE